MKKPLVVGLTGSIGMGKSTCTKMFARRGIPTLSADTVVHDLLKKGGAAEQRIAKKIPQAATARGISRRKLSSLVFQDEGKLRWLENTLHPLVFSSCKAFVRHQREGGKKMVILEVPLLFETGFDSFCDIVVCVSCSLAEQKRRVLARKGMTEKLFKSVRDKQMKDKEKRKRADLVILTDKGIDDTRRQVAEFLKRVKGICAK